MEFYFFLEVGECAFEMINGRRDIQVRHIFAGKKLRQIILKRFEGGAQALMFELFLPVAFIKESVVFAPQAIEAIDECPRLGVT